jgi:cation diffusion facilitator CzcD-associated flavoprotein CzcO
MTTEAAAQATASPHYDVIVIGAGFAGIGAAIKLRLQLPATPLHAFPW